jgi:hypothetical protein
MELIDKNKITFEPIELYNCDEHKHEVTGMALFKDIEKIPIVKAIQLDEIKRVRKEIDDLSRYYDNDIYSDNDDSMFKCDEVLEIIDKLIKEYESEEK